MRRISRDGKCESPEPDPLLHGLEQGTPLQSQLTPSVTTPNFVAYYRNS